jgi:hypothetical protein
VSGVEESASSCLDIELMPLSPPLLLSPDNESTITEDHPLLVWLPPMPVGKEKVLYDLKLVEILPNQTPYDAIQRNFAILEKQDISGTSLQYPANAMKIESGKRYAWKVNARTADRKPVGETEVWWFTKGEPGTSAQPESGADRYYIILDDASGKKSVTVKERLKIVSPDHINTNELQYTVIAQNGKEVPKDQIELISEGSGRFVLRFKDPSKLAGEHLRLIVTSPKGRKRYVAFTFIK